MLHRTPRHWENVYQTKGERHVSWFEESPEISLDLIRATGVSVDASIIDIGGGASRLANALLDEGFKAVAVLDLSEKARSCGFDSKTANAHSLYSIPICSSWRAPLFAFLAVVARSFPHIHLLEADDPRDSPAFHHIPRARECALPSVSTPSAATGKASPRASPVTARTMVFD